MIVVRLIGGLGNQFFQYAAARRLSLCLHAPLKLDTRMYQKDSLRTYQLDKFGIQADIATPAELARVHRPGRMNAILRCIGLATTYKERSYEFDAQVLSLKKSCYLEGYWQSYRYFEDRSEAIRAELTVTAPLLGKNRELFDRISNTDAICLHVRRGDYVSNPITKAYHGICAKQYYQAAVRELQEKAGTELFVFSDDIAWVREHLKFALPTTYVEHNSCDEAHEDLRLMTACRYFVIANSSFSWWGAWLSAFAEKIVYAPRQWLADPTINTAQLTPPAWRRI